MFESVLIANRGEIAIRIIRACKILNVNAIAIFSKEDENSSHVSMADEAYSLGNGSVYETYLNIDKIVEIAKESGAEAIHPGYGFLSENVEFVKALEKNNIRFIGPPAKALAILGDKVKAKNLAKDVGLPVAPGSKSYVLTFSEAKEVSEMIGFPVIIKAAFGGGGKGMEIVRNEETLEIALEGCQSIAKQYFGRDEVFIEKYVSSPRHVEIQFLADKYGNVVHLGDRECSIQRSHQKIIEEAPSFLTEREREELGEKVCNLARKLDYENAGTAEFLWKNGELYFNEVNPRIQVEHPVTEMVTGIDVVVEQIKIAAGEILRYKQDDVKINGHAIEFRINAEDPFHSFLPQSGKIEQLKLPGGINVRFDSHIYQSYSVPNTFDSLLGKLIVWGRDRLEAIERAKLAFTELVIGGIITNIDLHKTILETKQFQQGKLSTSFIKEAEILKKLNELERNKAVAIYAVSKQVKPKKQATPITNVKKTINQWKQLTKLEQQRGLI